MVDVLILPSPIVVFLTTWSIVLFVFCFFMCASYTATPNATLTAMTITLTLYTDGHFFLEIIPLIPGAALTPRLTLQAKYNKWV